MTALGTQSYSDDGISPGFEVINGIDEANFIPFGSDRSILIKGGLMAPYSFEKGELHIHSDHITGASHPFHIRIYDEGNIWWAIDEKSTNGSWLDGRFMEKGYPYRLGDLAHLRLGQGAKKIELRFRVELSIPDDSIGDARVVVDESAHTVSVDGKLITDSFTPKEWAFLKCLYDNSGRYVSREYVWKVVWSGQGSAKSDADAMNATLSRIRRKLGDKSCIETIRAQLEDQEGHIPGGYKLH